MPYKDCECVRILRDLKGINLYGNEQVSVKAGDLATIVSVFEDGTYEVEFFDGDDPNTGWGILHATEADLTPYAGNAV